MQKRAIEGVAESHRLRSHTSDGLAASSHPPKPEKFGEKSESGSEIKIEENAAITSILGSSVEIYKTEPKRRYSSSGLIKPEEDAEDRGNPKHPEEADDAGYKGPIKADVFQIDNQAINNLLPSQDSESQKSVPRPPEEASNPPTLLPRSEAAEPKVPQVSPIPANGILSMTRPMNPKEAQTQRDKRVEFFLLLEDLTAGMKRPCIMDLKMGTRQYGVDANEKKQKSQRRKCAETTSKELGVRVCGLQVWDVGTQTYIFQDKYFGRTLKSGREFQDALQRFLFNGVDYTSVLGHIPTILYKLSQLEVLIKDLRGYRFYAASLLMFYDGEVEDESAATDTSATAKELKTRKRGIDFKIADFANCVTAESGLAPVKQRACPPQHLEEPDKGFLRGLRSLRRYFVDIQKEVVEAERKKGADVEDGKNVINWHGLTDDPLDEDLGEVSY